MGYMATVREQHDFLAANGWGAFGAKVSMDRYELRKRPDGHTASPSDQILALLKAASGGADISGSSIEGFFYYPRGSFREWHTNERDALGWRMYLVHAERPNCAWFRYRDPHDGKIYTSADKEVTIRIFKIDNRAEPLWHSIESDCDRWSIGTRLNLSDDTIGLMLKYFQAMSTNSQHTVN